MKRALFYNRLGSSEFHYLTAISTNKTTVPTKLGDVVFHEAFVYGDDKPKAGKNNPKECDWVISGSVNTVISYNATKDCWFVKGQK